MQEANDYVDLDVHNDDEGMSTAEYCVGIGAACAFAGILIAIVQSSTVFDSMMRIVNLAFKFLG